MKESRKFKTVVCKATILVIVTKICFPYDYIRIPHNAIFQMNLLE